MQNILGAFEAKTHFAQLIERAIQGHETLITRRGKLVAKIVPIDATHDIKAAKITASRLRHLAQGMNFKNFSEQEWQEYRNMGRA